jgi:hypothetical protein
METTPQALRRIFNAAVAIAEERDSKSNYGNAWRESRSGLRGNLVMVDHKHTRLWNQLWMLPEEQWPLEAALDSALDAINYNAFIAILLQERLDEQRSNAPQS